MEGLREHLEKSEIEYIARHGGGYARLLKGMKDEEIIDYLRSIGFRIKERFKVDHYWVRTTNGISVNIAPADDDPDCPCGFVIVSTK